jgi:putative lipoic acid-binding regulatory protein
MSEGERVTSAVEHDRQRAIDLLEANHVFPGEYAFSVIALNEDAITAAVVGAIEAELGAPLEGEAREARPSSQGKYVSHRLRVRCQSAAQVLALYARLRGLQGVVTVL